MGNNLIIKLKKNLITLLCLLSLGAAAKENTKADRTATGKEKTCTVTVTISEQLVYYCPYTQVTSTFNMQQTSTSTGSDCNVAYSNAAAAAAILLTVAETKKLNDLKAACKPL